MSALKNIKGDDSSFALNISIPISQLLQEELR